MIERAGVNDRSCADPSCWSDGIPYSGMLESEIFTPRDQGISAIGNYPWIGAAKSRYTQNNPKPWFNPFYGSCSGASLFRLIRLLCVGEATPAFQGHSAVVGRALGTETVKGKYIRYTF